MKKFQITFKGQVYELDVEEIGSSTPTTVKAQATSAIVPAPVVAVAPVKTAAPKVVTPAGANTVLAPMPGKILGINVKKGDGVKRGAVICILEAMKMENEIMASQDGTIGDIQVTVGQTVSTGDALVVIN
jgi:biotin carboxyl carrier protein